jgi:hypothetical protein
LHTFRATGITVYREAGNTSMPRSVALDHAPGIAAVHWFLGERAGAAGDGAEEGSFASIANAGGLYIGVEIGFEVAMHRHLMAFAAFGGSEEFQETPRRGVSDDRRDDDLGPDDAGDPRRLIGLDDGQLSARFGSNSSMAPV